jgi:hypothetical protein
MLDLPGVIVCAACAPSPPKRLARDAAFEFDSTFFLADKRKARFFSALIARCCSSFCAATDEGDSKWKILQKRAESIQRVK